MQVFASILKCTELRDIICTKMNVLRKISKILECLIVWLLGEVNPWILYACVGWFLVYQLSFSFFQHVFLCLCYLCSACNFCVRDLSTTTLWQYSGILDNTSREMHFVCWCFTENYVYFCDITRLRFFLATQNLNVVIPGFWMRMIKEAFIEIFLDVFCYWYLKLPHFQFSATS